MSIDHFVTTLVSDVTHIQFCCNVVCIGACFTDQEKTKARFTDQEKQPRRRWQQRRWLLRRKTRKPSGIPSACTPRNPSRNIPNLSMIRSCNEHNQNLSRLTMSALNLRQRPKWPSGILRQENSWSLHQSFVTAISVNRHLALFLESQALVLSFGKVV